jgi:hypothetical protein
MPKHWLEMKITQVQMMIEGTVGPHWMILEAVDSSMLQRLATMLAADGSVIPGGWAWLIGNN